MKIADVAEFYSERGGGVRTYVREKLKASARLGHETIVIAPGPAEREETVEGGKIVWVKAPVLRLDPRYHVFFDQRPVYRVLDREAPDLVEGSSCWRGGWIAAGWRGPAPRVLFMHSDPVAQYLHTLLGSRLALQRIDRLVAAFWWYLRRLNARFGATVVASDWMERRLGGFGLNGVRSVPFGIDQGLFQPAKASRETRRQMLAACGLGEDARLLISIGRCHPEKRLDTVIEAAALANRSYPTGLYLVGDGPARAAIERRAAAAPHVHMAGFVADRSALAGLIASADALIHGSGAETFGLAVAEALASGTPIIAPAYGAAADLCGPGYAETYRLGDAPAAAAAIERLFSRDLGGLSDSAAAAGARIGSPDGHFDRLFALYQGLIAKTVPA